MGRSRSTTLALVTGALLASTAPVAAQEEEDVRNVGDWEIYTRVDPFTDATHVHVTVAVAPYNPVGIEAVSLSCDGADGSLSGTVFHSFLIATGTRNTVTVRFGTAEPRDMPGFTFSDHEMTDFELHQADLQDLRATPTRLAVRLFDAGDGNGYQSAWSQLKGTAEALNAVAACVDAVGASALGSTS